MDITSGNPSFQKEREPMATATETRVIPFARPLPPGRAANFFAYIAEFAERDPTDAHRALEYAAGMASQEGWPRLVIEREVRRVGRIIEEAERASQHCA
jgi:hypothetical protein